MHVEGAQVWTTCPTNQSKAHSSTRAAVIKSLVLRLYEQDSQKKPMMRQNWESGMLIKWKWEENIERDKEKKQKIMSITCQLTAPKDTNFQSYKTEYNCHDDGEMMPI